MTDTITKTASDAASKAKPKGLIGSLVTGPAMKSLADEAGKYAVARAEKLTRRLTSGPSKKAGAGTSDDGGGGKLSAVAEGAKDLAKGKSGPAAMVRTAATALREKVKAAFGGIGGGSGELKMTNIEESVDVGLPVDVVYNQWTQLSEFPKFMKGVETVEQESETESSWRVKVAFSRRSWKATTNEAIPDRRIVWTTEGDKGTTKGTVTFHALADDLTRVLLSMEYYPSGFFEKTGNIWRAGGRRTRLDLKHFRRFVSLNGEATGAWRGEIRDSEVVRQDEGEDGDRASSARDEGADRDDAKAREDQDRDEEDRADEGGDEEDEEDEEDREEAEPESRPRERQPSNA